MFKRNSNKKQHDEPEQDLDGKFIKNFCIPLNVNEYNFDDLPERIMKLTPHYLDLNEIGKHVKGKSTNNDFEYGDWCHLDFIRLYDFSFWSIKKYLGMYNLDGYSYTLVSKIICNYKDRIVAEIRHYEANLFTLENLNERAKFPIHKYTIHTTDVEMSELCNHALFTLQYILDEYERKEKKKMEEIRESVSRFYCKE